MDVYGPKLVLLLSFGSSAASYALTGMSHTMTMIYISRLPTLLQHAVMATRTAVGESSSEADRARLIGYTGVAYGIGMAIGPVIGGLLAKHDLRLSAWVAAAGSMLSFCAFPRGRHRPPLLGDPLRPDHVPLCSQSSVNPSFLPGPGQVSAQGRHEGCREEEGAPQTRGRLQQCRMRQEALSPHAICWPRFACVDGRGSQTLHMRRCPCRRCL